MPQYTFEHIETGEIRDVFFHMNDEKIYNGEKGDELEKWKRVWMKPQAGIDTKIDPFNSNQFVEKTAGKGTLGDLWDRSAEMSAMRAAKRDGIDPIKQANIERLKRERGGKHVIDQRHEKRK